MWCSRTYLVFAHERIGGVIVLRQFAKIMGEAKAIVDKYNPVPLSSVLLSKEEAEKFTEQAKKQAGQWPRC